jgi:hypothetical protein
MSYDPNIPATNAEATSAMFRAQFNGLKDLIDTALSVNAAQVDSTNTLPPGTPANASVSRIGNSLHFSFDLPQGADGEPGPMGAQGPAFANAVVDSVNTVDPGTPASVNVSYDGSNVRFTFDIPRGFDGQAGNDGAPGEVSLAELNNVISSSSANSNNVSTLALGASPDYDQSQLQTLANKIDELINALRR